MAGHSQRLRVAPHRKGLPEGHAPITRELVVPIMRSDLIVAVVGVGNKLSDYTDSDVQIVSHLADVAWTIIERKRTEQALQESETRYRKAAETLAEADRNKNQFSGRALARTAQSARAHYQQPLHPRPRGSRRRTGESSTDGDWPTGRTARSLG